MYTAMEKTANSWTGIFEDLQIFADSGRENGGPCGSAVCGMAFSRLASLPPDVSWRQMSGIGLLCGVGFTMSLLITHLAFGGSPAADHARAGVLLGSFFSALAGGSLLFLSGRRRVSRFHESVVSGKIPN